jgi:hypothetical protein
MHAAAAELDEEEHVEQTDGLDREEVDRERAVRPRAQEVAPAGPTALAAGSKPASFRSFRTAVAETATPSPPSSPTIRR